MRLLLQVPPRTGPGQKEITNMSKTCRSSFEESRKCHHLYLWMEMLWSLTSSDVSCTYFGTGLRVQPVSLQATEYIFKQISGWELLHGVKF